MEDKKVQQPTFLQIVRHPVTYALVVVVSVFWTVLYYVTDRESSQNDKMLEMQDRLYKQMIEEVRQQVTPAVNKVNEAATKVDSAAVKVDSVAQQQKRRGGKR
ncbi:hypothetical protein [Sphingobacterium faecium]|uniref:hypothetical protein n=1 Tax=Sphingobacterium faecium TaxID=34087 RepID=UPI002468C064|nr:hypothetical protein [Sphingobacterium faecium]MDH5825778.1 hypothetical protein [Sphingobacterium faecium]